MKLEKMKRELKFRAWDKVDNRMIVHEQNFIPLKVTSMGVLRLNPHHKEMFWEFMPSERFELMQFTGLKDKIGKEIYECDIVKTTHGDIDVINYDEIAYNLMVAYAASPKGKCVEWFKDGGNPLDGIEVIGNIFENPELL